MIISPPNFLLFRTPFVERNKTTNNIPSDNNNNGVTTTTSLATTTITTPESVTFEQNHNCNLISQQNNEITYQNIINHKYDDEFDEELTNISSNTCQNLIQLLLDPNPLTRLTISQMLGHNWFTLSS